jgi:putative glutamine amidotransferase
MNVLITQRHAVNNHGDWIDSLENSYIEFFESFGMNLIPIPNVSRNIDKLISITDADGIILSGGGDVNPELFGSDIKGCNVSKERDECESMLLKIAVSKDIPVFGICRGMQFINVYFGGKLLSNIGSIDPEAKHRIAGSHSIRVMSDEITHRIGGTGELQTNSYHEHGMLENDLGKHICSFAIFDELGLIEGIYHSKYPIAGVQWHPERNCAPAALDKFLIESFVGRKLFWRKAR